MSYAPKKLHFPIAWRTTSTSVTAAEQTVAMEECKNARGSISITETLEGLGFSDATSDTGPGFAGFGGHSPTNGAGYGCDHPRYYQSRISGTNIGAGIVNNTPSIRYRAYDANSLLAACSLWVI